MLILDGVIDGKLFTQCTSSIAWVALCLCGKLLAVISRCGSILAINLSGLAQTKRR